MGLYEVKICINSNKSFEKLDLMSLSPKNPFMTSIEKEKESIDSHYDDCHEQLIAHTASTRFWRGDIRNSDENS
jgi:hypothetical protein